MDSLSDGQIAKTNAQKKRNFQQYVAKRIESFSLSFVFFLWLFNKSSESKLTRRRKEQQLFVLLGVVSFHSSSSSSFSSFLNNQNDSHFAQTRANVSLWTSSSSHLDHTHLVHSSVGKETSRRLFSHIVVRHTDASHSHAYIPDRSPIVHGCGLLCRECNLQLIERIETARSRSALVLCGWSSTSSLRGKEREFTTADVQAAKWAYWLRCCCLDAFVRDGTLPSLLECLGERASNIRYSHKRNRKHQKINEIN